MIELVLLILGIPALWKGADWLVVGGSALATRFGISPFVIGLTVVSFGTSAPELFVNIIAAVRGDTQLAMGSVLGSNVANVLLVLGVAAALRPLKVTSTTVRIEIPFTALATLVVAALLYDVTLQSGRVSHISHGDGIVLLAFFILFMAYVWHLPRGPQATPETVHMPVWKASGLLLVGLVGLAIGSNWLVDGSLWLAAAIGISTSTVGFVVVALGTSLPELATTVQAVRRREQDLAVGNIVGSNIFNLLWILGVTALVRPIEVAGDTLALLVAAFGSNLLLLGFLGKRDTLTRWHGWMFVIAYVAFVTWLALQQL